jgi:tetratricopeptide (TPR) repeat protein
MGPAFDRWLSSLNSFQRRRGAGLVSIPWDDLRQLELKVDDLILDGLDSRSAAACLIELETASLLLEEQRFGECLSIASAAIPSIPIYGPVAELIHSNRELVIGNVYLVRDEAYETAAEYFRRSIDASGLATPLIRGNAAFNLGVCLTILDQNTEAIESYKMAAQSYVEADRNDKLGDVLHAIGNIYRKMDEMEVSLDFLFKALESYKDPINYVGTWKVADDISRVCMTLANNHLDEREVWLERAGAMSDHAMFAVTQVWNTSRDEEGRLTDLSEQMLHLATTRCEIAMLGDSPDELLATLAVTKGRIRLTQSTIPPSALEEKDDKFREAISAGDPFAHLELVLEALEQLSEGHTVALVDQFALYGNHLAIAYVVASKKVLGGYCPRIGDALDSAALPGLRGRRRGVEIGDACQQLLHRIASHSQRCCMVVPENPEETNEATRDQLQTWSDELTDDLSKLGHVFFPSEMLEDFRNLGVDKVILCIDPLFARTPFQSLIGKHGQIVDEPWDLSIVTSSMELVRMVDRGRRQPAGERVIRWFGPDADVNTRLGGNEEFAAISGVFSAIPIREESATIERITAFLQNGEICHFRGHGHWSGIVETSGPVLANGILSTETLVGASDYPGFLFTAACLTGFGEAVGSEMLGSFVDYDRAGLFGAVLTSWPIHGRAATVFTKRFYENLATTGDAATALRAAWLETRCILPHPYLWAPFTLVGGWNLQAH